MSTEENKAIYRRIWDELLNKGNLAVVDELVAPSYVFHDPQGSFSGPQGLKQFITAFRSAFSDMQFTVEDMIAEGDKVVKRWTLRAKHTGDFMGITPTGKQVEITGTSIGRFADGRSVEDWEALDHLGLMQQLGVVPPP